MRAGQPSPLIVATSALDHLYQIDTPEALQECLSTFLTAVKGSFKTLSKKDEDALIAAVTTGDKPINPELYQRYAGSFHRAVDAVPIDDTDLSTQWHANVSRFAAYKAYHATEELRRLADEEDGDLAILRATLHKYNRYQAAEYNTAVARARTGKQWQQFAEDDNRRLFPCIKWLPSRSATPREEHIPFYNRIWAKDDPFWTYNQPGTLWNCKCDWEQTDEAPTDGNPDRRIVKPGLDQNPATSGMIFTDTASYIKAAGKRGTRIIDQFGCAYLRQQATEFDLSASSSLGEVSINKICATETAKASVGRDGYWLKNEVMQNLDKFLPSFKYMGQENIDLSHNSKSGKAYKLKKKAKCMHIFEGTVGTTKITCKVLEMKDDGKLVAYTVYT